MLQNIIALTGRRGSGKDTAARTIIENELFFNSESAAIANKLKDIVIEKLNTSPISLQAYGIVDIQKLEEIKNDKFIRTLLQSTGDDIRELNGHNYLIKELLNEHENHNGTLIITDLRTVAEWEYLEQYADELNIPMCIIKLKDCSSSGQTDSCDKHRTETEVDEICEYITIDNYKNGEKELYNKLREAIKMFYKDNYDKRILKFIFNKKHDNKSIPHQITDIEKIDMVIEAYETNKKNKPIDILQEIGNKVIQEHIDVLNKSENKLPFNETKSIPHGRKDIKQFFDEIHDALNNVYILVINSIIRGIYNEYEQAKDDQQKAKEEWAFKWDDTDFNSFIKKVELNKLHDKHI